MKNTSKTALGGMAVALGTVIMLLASAIPTLEYAIPAAAGFMVLFILVELGVGWSVGVYFATALLSIFIVPNKESVGMYIALFGLYPIVKFFLDKLPKIPSYIIKCVFFAVMTVGVYFIMIKLFSIATELLEDMNKFTLPLLIVLGMAAFLVYDRAMTLMAKKYKLRYHKYVVKMFNGRK